MTISSIIGNIHSKATGYSVYAICLAIITVLITGAWYEGKWRGRQEQRVLYAQERLEATNRGVQAHAKTQREVQKLSDPDIDADLTKWLRD